MKLVVDTNAFINSAGIKSKNRAFFEAFKAGAFELCISNEIFLEYEEMLPKFFNEILCQTFIEVLLLSKNVLFVTPSYAFNLSSDPDDNKFVDAYLAGNANYLISNDKALLALAAAVHPPINVLTIETFTEKLRQSA